MTIKLIQDGTTLNHVVSGSAIVSGEVVAMTHMIGIAHEGAAVGATVALHTVGVLPLAANANVDTVGEDVFWDGSELTTIATSNTPAGQCWRVVTGGIAHVRLNSTSVADA